MLHTKLLKKIIKYCRQKNYVFSAKDCLISVPEFNEALDCSFCYGQFESTMRYLIEDNYIERVGKDFRLSYKALYRKEILTKKLWQFARTAFFSLFLYLSLRHCLRC